VIRRWSDARFDLLRHGARYKSAQVLQPAYVSAQLQQHHINKTMNLRHGALVALFCLLFNSAWAQVPIACSSLPDSSNCFPTASAHACTFRRPELIDFYNNKTGAAAFLAAHGCKPSAATSDANVGESVFALLTYFYSVRNPLPDGVGTLYPSPHTCSLASAVTATCGFSSSKRQQFNAEVERRDQAKRGPKSPTPAPPTPAPCNNPNIPSACGVTYGTYPFDWNATHWNGDFNVEPNILAASFPTLYDFFNDQGGASQFLGAYFGVSSSEWLACALPSGVANGGTASIAMKRIAASVYRYFSCSLEGGNGSGCDCTAVNAWYTNICPST
jgi:hypothetical protein